MKELVLNAILYGKISGNLAELHFEQAEAKYSRALSEKLWHT
jgi:hypothetical protein